LLALIGRLRRAAALRTARLVHGPDRAGVPRELLREGAFLLAGRVRATLAVSWPEGRFVVSTADYDVSRRTFVAGPYGLERLKRAATLIERHGGRSIRGGEVLEIGANIGTTTVPLLTTLGAARVHAFEPIPRNFELLRRNVELNDLSERVAAHQLAVSNRSGQLSMSLPDRFWGSSRVSEADERAHTASCTTVDQLLAAGEIDQRRLALVWIDVEGHELAVLEGAASLEPTPIVLEHDPAQQADLGELHRWIEARAGTIHDLASGNQTTLEALEQEAGATDLLLLP
jgi:FkbM family methyltransferase